jgi:putative hydrolase of the HAD superfamily
MYRLLGGVKLIKAVVFDFDGLILDTETEWYYAFKEVLQDYRVELPMEVFVKSIGTDDTELNNYMEQKIGLASSTAIKKLARENHKARIKMIAMRDGVKAYLTNAKELGLKIGLASSSPREWVEGYLRDLQIIDYFQVIKTGDEVEKVKPDPALYIKALEGLGVNADEAIAFEDSANGAKAAVAAGLKCVIVPNEVTQSLAFEKYDLRINSMLEMSLEQVITYVEN